MKNWTGNIVSVHSVLGSRNFAKTDREQYDFYATPPKAVEFLLKFNLFDLNIPIFEPACGNGHIAEVLKKANFKVYCNDILKREYPLDSVKDFFEFSTWNGNIITNPPYKYAMEFVLHSLKIIPVGKLVGMFLKLQFLEGKKRRDSLYSKYPPKYVYVSSSRLTCGKNGNFNKNKESSAVAYCWFIWEKGFKGDPILKWFN